MIAGVPIPDRMRHLDRDRRGLPIPVIVYRDDAGRPHFTINDDVIRDRLIRADRCGICGGKLLRGRWFVGGPASAFHEHGAYIDPPMHGECAAYALAVCPYLARRNYSRRIDDATLDPTDRPLILDDPTMMPERPEVFVAVMATGQRLNFADVMLGPVAAARVVRTITPHRPYRRIEYWRHGVRIDELVALALIPPDPAPPAGRAS